MKKTYNKTFEEWFGSRCGVWQNQGEYNKCKYSSKLAWNHQQQKIQNQRELIEKYENKEKEILKYCEPHLETMWAASVASILLECDFRDCAKQIKDKLNKGE